MTPDDFKAWREDMGWTQKEAGRQLGLSTRNIIRIEQGVNSAGKPMDISRTIQLATHALRLNENLQEK